MRAVPKNVEMAPVRTKLAKTANGAREQQPHKLKDIQGMEHYHPNPCQKC